MKSLLSVLCVGAALVVATSSALADEYYYYRHEEHHTRTEMHYSVSAPSCGHHCGGPAGSYGAVVRDYRPLSYYGPTHVMPYTPPPPRYAPSCSHGGHPQHGGCSHQQQRPQCNHCGH